MVCGWLLSILSSLSLGFFFSRLLTVGRHVSLDLDFAPSSTDLMALDKSCRFCHFVRDDGVNGGAYSCFLIEDRLMWAEKELATNGSSGAGPKNSKAHLPPKTFRPAAV